MQTNPFWSEDFPRPIDLPVTTLPAITDVAIVGSGYTGLAVLMMLASVPGLYYYLRVVWYMYFEEPEDLAVLQANTDTRVVMSLNGVAVLALGIVPGWLWALCLAVLA